MIGALGKMQDWETLCRSILNNDVTKEEIRAAIHILNNDGVYKDWECFRATRKFL
ncbi:hypothetical protein X732_30445 [Mesorhizobium sp. L2C066B000]|nr:hypothetical protein X732_30445 [Mesorhizobium sp. L2C066B000]